MFKYATAFVAVLVASAQAGTVLWDGTLDASFTSASFDKWSWGNQVGPYQWYIHGPSATSNYLGVSSSFKNPADTTSAQGIRTTIDGTAFWNGQTMARTEIIPQTKANLGSGHLYYHFSLKTSSTNAPNPKFEHQIAFFESHFVELKYGLLSGASGTSDNTLRFMISQNTKWSTQLAPDTWYNFAYDIDFSAGTAGLWASTGSSPLTQVVANQAASTSTNSADFHIGVLRLPNGGTSSVPEDYFWSGVYVESGSITTSIAGPRPGSGGSGGSGTTVVPTTAPATTSPATTPVTTSKSSTVVTTKSSTVAPAPTAVAQHYGQCGGKGWSGPTVCADGYTCKASGEYYSQCL